MVLSSTFRDPVTFARMASVEELDSSLTLLTHHTAKVRKNSRTTSEISSLSAADDNIKNFPQILDAVKPNTVSATANVDILQNAAAALLTPPGSPYFVRTISPETTVKQTFDYFSPLLTPTKNPELLQLDSSNVDSRTVVGSSASGPNVVAIDNKIEQAMDLVKTHLTFAVREEVEILRSAIVELEAKVSQLESQNQLLRQFAPAEVLANLGYYIQKKKEAQQVTMAPSVSVPSVAFQGMAVPVQPVNAASAQTLVMQSQTAPSNVAAVAPTFATQHTAALSTQTITLQQQQTSLQQTISASTPSLTAQHAASLLQSSLNQQVATLTQQQQQQSQPQQQQNVIQATIQQQTLTAQKTTLLAQASASSPQLPQMVQQAVATKHVSNIAVATLPIGSNEVLMQAQQQPSLSSTATSGQLSYVDPNDPKPTMM